MKTIRTLIASALIKLGKWIQPELQAGGGPGEEQPPKK